MQISDATSQANQRIIWLKPTVLKALALLWLSLVILLAASALQKEIGFDSSLMALLPQEEPSVQVESAQAELLQVQTRALLQQANDQIAHSFSNRYLLLLSGQDDKVLRNAVADLAQHLSRIPAVEDVAWRISPEVLQQRQQELFEYRFALLDKRLRQQLEEGQGDQIRHKALLRLYSPVSVQVGSLQQDPFGLYSEWLLHQSQGLNLHLDRQLMKVGVDEALLEADPAAGQKPDITYLLILTFSGDAFALTTQQQILSVIEQQQQQLQQRGVSLQQSGLLRHAAAGAQQASHEISTIGVGSLLGILLLLWLVFRSAVPLVMVLLPMSVAVLTAASVTGLYFGSIHLITLAFGAGLIGVSIDYSLHYLCEYQGLNHYSISHTDHSTISEPQQRLVKKQQRALIAIKALTKVWPGLLLGLFSSVAAYGVLAIPPFPGLQQMALFSVVGLASAWLSVVLFFPLLTSVLALKPISNQYSNNSSDQHGLSDSARLFCRLQQGIKYAFNKSGITPKLTVFVAVLLVSVFSLYSLLQSNYQDDVRLLQTSPPELLAAESKVQQRLGSFSSSQFLLIRCGDWQQCLEQEEALQPELAQLQKLGVFQRYQAVSQQLPSLKMQQENINLVQDLYQNQLEIFFRQLKLPEEKWLQAQTFLKQDSELLTPEHWLTLNSSEGYRELLVADIVKDSDVGQYASMIRFSGLSQSAELLQPLKQLAQRHAGVEFADRVATISDLMTQYRSKVISWLVWAYVLVFLVLLWRYKQQVWRVITPPMLASLLTLALVAQLEQGINLFHIMALILVLGIGLDMSIFLQESRGSLQTWLAVSLSSCTSLLAFGLLTLSQTPVLHHFGLVVLIGLTLTWVLAFLLSNNNVTENLDDNAARNH